MIPRSAALKTNALTWMVMASSALWPASAMLPSGRLYLELRRRLQSSSGAPGAGKGRQPSTADECRRQSKTLQTPGGRVALPG